MRTFAFTLITIWLASAFAYNANAVTCAAGILKGLEKTTKMSQKIVSIVGSNRVAHDDGERIVYLPVDKIEVARYYFDNSHTFSITALRSKFVWGYFDGANINEQPELLQVSEQMIGHIKHMLEHRDRDRQKVTIRVMIQDAPALLFKDLMDGPPPRLFGQDGQTNGSEFPDEYPNGRRDPAPAYP